MIRLGKITISGRALTIIFGGFMSNSSVFDPTVFDPKKVDEETAGFNAAIEKAMAAAAFNFKKLMKQLLNNFFQIFVTLNIFAKPVEFENTVTYA